MVRHRWARATSNTRASGSFGPASYRLSIASHPATPTGWWIQPCVSGSTQAAIRPTLIDAEKSLCYFSMPASTNDRLLSVAEGLAVLFRECVSRCLEVLDGEFLELVRRDVLELSLVGHGGSSHA